MVDRARSTRTRLVTQAHDPTARVPAPRIAGDAAEEGVTAAVFLSRLVDQYERDRRFAQVRRAYAGYAAGGTDSDYAELAQAWDQATDQDADTAEVLDGA